MASCDMQGFQYHLPCYISLVIEVPKYLDFLLDRVSRKFRGQKACIMCNLFDYVLIAKVPIEHLWLIYITLFIIFYLFLLNFYHSSDSNKIFL